VNDPESSATPPPAAEAVPEAQPLHESLADELPELTESMKLVQEAQAGSREALEALLTRYQDRVLRIVRIRISNKLRKHVESMDVVQETLRKAAANLNELELRSQAAILQWLAKIAENQMLDVNRRMSAAKRDRSREQPLERRTDSGDFFGMPAADQAPPDEIAAQRELARLVDECVAELPDEYREVVTLRTYCGGSWEWVTQQMGRESTEATRQLHRRASVKLGRMLQERMKKR
jgi:RNA polymerase sigma-70 factor, ECF subfamily